MRISDWSSDVCSSDLSTPPSVRMGVDQAPAKVRASTLPRRQAQARHPATQSRSVMMAKPRASAAASIGPERIRANGIPRKLTKIARPSVNQRAGRGSSGPSSAVTALQAANVTARHDNAVQNRSEEHQSELQ